MTIFYMVLIKLNHLILLILKLKEKKHHGMILEGTILFYLYIYIYIFFFSVIYLFIYLFIFLFIYLYIFIKLKNRYKEIVEKIKHLVKWPLLYPETYTKLGVKPPSGLILYGPSGNKNKYL